jgi:AbrB family looped-hinge helix DNA binding protein
MRVQVTGKGQVTIPVELRRELELRGGEELLLEVVGPGEFTLRRPASSGELMGSAPATRPYPGKIEVRAQAARRAAARKQRAAPRREAGMRRAA